MWFKREISEKLQQIRSHYPVIMLTGARQVGKSSLLKKVFKDFEYVSLDLPSLAEQADEDPFEFLKNRQKHLIVDEAQYAPGLFRALKQIVDKMESKETQFILSGSQNFKLMKEVSESLSGRVAILELEALSLHEIKGSIEYKNNPENLHELISRGSFPALWENREIEPFLFYKSYLNTYLERDLRELLNVSSLRDFERFIRITASRSGNLLVKSDLAKDVGVSSKAISSWISVLQASNQITLLEPYFQNISKRMIKSPKVYFNNTGLLCYLLNIKKESIQDSPFRGMLFETLVFSELRKRNRVHENYQYYFYRDQQAREIDLFILDGHKVELAEIKFKQSPNKNDVKWIHQIAKDIEESNTNLQLNKKSVFTTGKEKGQLYGCGLNNLWDY